MCSEQRKDLTCYQSSRGLAAPLAVQTKNKAYEQIHFSATYSPMTQQMLVQWDSIKIHTSGICPDCQARHSGLSNSVVCFVQTLQIHRPYSDL